MDVLIPAGFSFASASVLGAFLCFFMPFWVILGYFFGYFSTILGCFSTI
jgi:hypothetical protein